MARAPTIDISVTADTSQAQSALRGMGDAADTATRQSRDLSGAVDTVGGTSAQLTTGMRDLGGALSQMGGTMGAVGTAMETSAIAFEALDGAATLYSAATSISTAATSAFSKAMNFLKVSILTNPIFIIAAIIIGIAAALIIAYQKSETFRAIVDAAFKAVGDAVAKVWDWIKRLADIIGGALSSAWDIAKRAATIYFDIITTPIKWLIEQVQKLVDWIGNIHWPSPPAWLSKIGSVVGLSAAPATATTRGVAPFATTTAGRSASAPGGVVINISGALDPDGVARQIRRVLGVNDRRTGRAYMAAS